MSYGKQTLASVSQKRAAARQQRAVFAQGAFAPRGLSVMPRHSGVFRDGLEQLLQNAAEQFKAETGHAMPHNFYKSHILIYASYSRRHFGEAANLAVEETARFAGLIRHAPEYPALRAAICCTQCRAGLNSPWTSCNLLSVARNAGFNPGVLERRIGAVHWRAQEILRPFGKRASMHAVMRAIELTPSSSTRKVAYVAAAIALGGYVRSFREARAFLIKEGIAAREARA